MDSGSFPNSPEKFVCAVDCSKCRNSQLFKVHRTRTPLCAQPHMGHLSHTSPTVIENYWGNQGRKIARAKMSQRTWVKQCFLDKNWGLLSWVHSSCGCLDKIRLANILAWGLKDFCSNPEKLLTANVCGRPGQIWLLRDQPLRSG